MNHNHFIQQPKTSLKQKKSSKVASHPEIHPNKTLDQLEGKEWTAAIQKEIGQLEQALQQVESLIKEASESQNQICLGSTKLVHDEFEFAALKLQVLKEMLAKYTEIETKQTQIQQNLSQDQKIILHQEREKIQFQFGIAQRILVLIQAYIKMKDQFEDHDILLKHRDYILQKIDKIKKTEEKHTKKIEKHFKGIIIDDPNNFQEIEDEEEQIYEESGYEGITSTVREHLIKLCDSLIVYFTKFEKKEENQFLQHDLTTFQYFDQIKVAVPFYSAQIDQTIELIKEKRSFYENAPDTEFVQTGVKKGVKQQEQKVDLNNEQEFPKLS